MKKLVLTVLGFMAGMLAGLFIKLGYEVLMARPGAPGGEALIPLLILLLLIFGYALGRMTKDVEREWHQLDEEPPKRLPPSYSDGYSDGFRAGCVFAEDISPHERV